MTAQDQPNPWDSATPETRALLGTFENSASPPLHALGVEGARAATSAAARYLQGPPVEVAQVRDLIIKGPVGDLSVRVYDPDPGTLSPLVIYVHGGGWVTGDLDVVDGPCRRLAQGLNSVVVSLGYRRSPEAPAGSGVEDLDACLEWCASHRPELGARADGLALVGDSAGAHLIASLLACGRRHHVSDAVLLYPPILRSRGPRRGSYVEYAGSPILSADTMDWFWEQYLPSTAAQPHSALVPGADLRDFPRTLLVSAGMDILRDEGLDFAGRLRDADVEVEVIEYPGLAHGFFWMDRFIPEAISLVDAIGAFLHRRAT